MKYSDNWCGAWCVGIINEYQWIMITNVRPVKWVKVGTRGDSKNYNWILRYYLMYSFDGSSWMEYKNKIAQTILMWFSNMRLISEFEYKYI